MISIQETGRFFELDAAGYIVNDTSRDRILPEFLPLLAAIVQTYQKELGAQLHSIYLRGTLARGLFSAISDIDTFALVHQPGLRWKKTNWPVEYRSSWPVIGRFSGEIEMMLSSFQSNLRSNYPGLAVQIKTQSLCLFGDDVAAQIAPYRIERDLMLNSPWLAADLADYQANPSLASGRQLMKTILRSGFELVMQRMQAYTPDLYLCYRSFTKFYPRQEKLMKQALHNYLNPTDIDQSISQITAELLPFLEREIRHHLGDL
ncbi:MAG: hypothetical protein AAF985_14320 [Bacteroidota bacterium]